MAKDKALGMPQPVSRTLDPVKYLRAVRVRRKAVAKLSRMKAKLLRKAVKELLGKHKPPSRLPARKTHRVTEKDMEQQY